MNLAHRLGKLEATAKGGAYSHLEARDMTDAQLIAIINTAGPEFAKKYGAWLAVANDKELSRILASIEGPR